MTNSPANQSPSPENESPGDSNDPNNSSDPRPSRSALVGVLVVIIAGTVVSLAALWRSKHREQGQPTAFSQTSLVMFNKAVEAIAASEDQDYERGLKLWRELSILDPEQPAFHLNQAVTVLKWIDDVNKELASGKVEPDRKAILNQGLEKAIEEAGGVIQSLESLGEEVDEARLALLKAGLLEVQAQPLRYPEDIPFLTEAAEVLASVLREDPGQPLLAAKYDLLASPLIDEDDDPRWKLIADAYYASWQAEPRNMYLMSCANEALFRLQDKRVLDLFEPSWEVSKPMQSMVEREIGILKPEQTMENARAAIEAGEWRKAGRVNMWYKVMLGMSGFNPDARRVNPDMMALLDTSFLNEMAKQLPVAAEAAPTKPKFEVQKLPSEVQAIRWFDYDLDLDFELLVVSGSELQLYEIESNQLVIDPVQRLDLGFEPSGMLIGEFFKVDDTQRNRLPGSVAELMQEDEAAVENSEASKPKLYNRHDTFQEVVLWNSASDEPPVFVGVKVEADRYQLQIFEEETLIEVAGVEIAEVIDIESDGDLDLLLATGSEIHLLQNNGNRTFLDITKFSDFEELGLTEENHVVDLAVADFDGDLDQDVLCLVEGKNQPFFLENLLHGQFRARALEDEAWTEVSDAKSLAIADMDGNGCWDVIISSASGTYIRFGMQILPGETKGLAEIELEPGQKVVAGDFNNDGYQDLFLPSRLELGAGQSQFLGEVLEVTNLSESEFGFGVEVDVVDANQDGALDVAGINVAGMNVAGMGDTIAVAWGQPSSNAKHLAVRVRGIDDVNGGGRNNHFGIGSTLEVWSQGRQTRQIVRQPVTHFGLGPYKAENLRIVFANGLTQNVERPEPGILVEEKQELKGSCPFVYGWNGERFELITDLLWNAPLGLQIARGQTLPDRRWENLVLPGAMMQPKDGFYELQVTEELWEVAYFDQIRLTAIDHPRATRLFSNEKVGPPHIAEHRLFTPRKVNYPKRAVDAKGRDQLANLSEVDGKYAQGFESLICQGLAEPHFIEMDFGEIPVDADARLFMTGWMHPTDTSLNIGIAQNGDRPAPEPPSLWVVDADGNWVCTQPYTGFPGGKPKSIVIDLAGVFRSEDQRIRIASSQQIYWDEAFVSWTHDPEVVSQALELRDADLHYRGFGALLPRSPDQPHRYDYQNVSQEQKWPPLTGPFTRFGDVRSILELDDDRLVVLDSGDEITLRFKMPAMATPEGWQRDFVLSSTGWDKDADLNTLAGQGSLPLPYAAQQQYPSDGADAQAERVLRKNLPTLTREPTFIFPVVKQEAANR